MEELMLVIPNESHERAAFEYKNEFFEHGEAADGIEGSSRLTSFATYAEWLSWIEAFREKATTPKPYAPSTTYFCVRESDGRIVGITDVRHELTENLLRCGGHIGYSIRPTERRRGYATQMLALALEKCREMGIKKALVTCDHDNTGSARTIEKNGGVLENEVIDNGELVKRYWIAID